VLRRYDAELDAAYEQAARTATLPHSCRRSAAGGSRPTPGATPQLSYCVHSISASINEELVTSGSMLAASAAAGLREPMDRMGQDRSQSMALAAFVLVPRWCSAPPWTVSSPA
jgi:hypothetical protein